MKKLLSLIVLMFAFVAISEAQSFPMTGTGDSVVNTGTKTCTYKVAYTPTAVTVQYTLTRASGTIAGKTYLQSSIDGVSYSNIDSFTAINIASNVKIFIVANPKSYAFYRTSSTGSGTMKAYITARIIARKD
jgi:hypothetical protein